MQRSYVLKARAKTQEETRQRIVASAAELHEEIGAKATTISAIAERAGVQRLTVYRHFSDESELFTACTTYWLHLNPLPDPSAWAQLSGMRKCREALSALYAYYRKTERMWEMAHRDEPDVPALKPPMDRFRDYLSEIADDLAKNLAPTRNTRKAVSVTLAHILRFTTWQSLATEGLTDDGMARLACDWLASVERR